MAADELSHFRRRSTTPNSQTYKEGANSGTPVIMRTRKIITKTLQAVDEMMRLIGQKTLDAVIKAVRGSLDELWQPFGLKKASAALKNVLPGTSVKSSKLYVFNKMHLKSGRILYLESIKN